MDVMIIFKGATVVQSIAAYLGLIDSVSSETKKLLHQSFLSAVDLLNFAKNVSGEQQKVYLNQALLKFVEATAVEKNENLVSAFLGLAMCQHLLGDYENAKLSMESLEKVELSFGEILKSSWSTNVVQSRIKQRNRKQRFKIYKIKTLEAITVQI